MNEAIRELLYRSCDTALTPTENAELERALAASPELRAEQEQIAHLRKALGQSAAVGFPLGFAERVLGRLHPPMSGRSDAELVLLSMRRLFRWVAAAGLPACAVLFVWYLQREPADRTAAADLLWETPVELILENGQ
jgi:anti-sigma factor RsiW